MNRKQSTGRGATTTTTTVLQRKNGNKTDSGKYSAKKTRKTSKDNGILDQKAALMVAVVAVAASALYVYISRDFRPDESGLMLAAFHETIDKRFIDLECYREDHQNAPEAEQNELADCVPKCGRAVMDNVINKEEVNLLKNTMKKLIKIANSSDYVSYVDYISGQLYFKNNYTNMYEIPAVKEAIPKDDFEQITAIFRRLQKLMIDTFNGTLDKISDFKGIESFAIIPGPDKRENEKAYSIHTENLVTVGVCYSALLYLSDFEVDFFGSRLTFHERFTNKTVHIVHPKKARFVVFTSGSENNHRVEEIVSGERYAISFGLSCNKTSRPFPTYQNFSQTVVQNESFSGKY